MELLLKEAPITSQNIIKGLRQFYDTVQSNTRGLNALGISQGLYDGLLALDVMSKLLPKMLLIVSRGSSEDEWYLGRMMELIERGSERERTTSWRAVQTGTNSGLTDQGDSKVTTDHCYSTGHRAFPTSCSCLL